MKLFDGCAGGTARHGMTLTLCAMTASVAELPSPSGTAVKCPQSSYVLDLLKNIISIN